MQNDPAWGRIALPGEEEVARATPGVLVANQVEDSFVVASGDLSTGVPVGETTLGSGER